jgi:hypothetical protein
MRTLALLALANIPARKLALEASRQRLLRHRALLAR